MIKEYTAKPKCKHMCISYQNQLVRMQTLMHSAHSEHDTVMDQRSDYILLPAKKSDQTPLRT